MASCGTIGAWPPSACKSSVVMSELPEGSGTSELAAISRARSMVMLSREICTAGSPVVSNSETVFTAQSRLAGWSGTPSVPSTRGWGGCATYDRPLASRTGCCDASPSWPGAGAACGACATSQSPS
ncbi:Uncharacterised protein [Bordetella pertussis]|nr:Uncharacterised protein [Bordetella pertussis]